MRKGAEGTMFLIKIVLSDRVGSNAKTSIDGIVASEGLPFLGNGERVIGWVDKKEVC